VALSPGLQYPATWNIAISGTLRGLVRIAEALAALLLAADLVVVGMAVLFRYVLDAPLEWSDDVARMLLVATSFFGSAAALARNEHAGIEFVVDRLPPRLAAVVRAAGSFVVLFVAVAITWNTISLAMHTVGQTTGSGLAQTLFYLPMAGAGACMAVFALAQVADRRPADIALGALIVALPSVVLLVWLHVAPDNGPSPALMMIVAFVICLIGAVPIGFVLAFTTLAFLGANPALPGAIIAQQTVRGIDNFVLLAVPFFVLVGYVMEANGMSVRLIELLHRMVGRARGGLNVVMVLSMVLFSGVSGSKMADVAAVGSVLVPAARRSRLDPGDAVALLAASAIMAEVIPPCMNLIILGFVANLSIGGLFLAGLLPAALMAAGLIMVGVAFGRRAEIVVDERTAQGSGAKLAGSAVITVGLIVIIFGGYRSGFASATEISAFAVMYAVVVGGLAFRELTVASLLQVLVGSARRSGMVLFITAVAQSVGFVLTLEHLPQALAEFLVNLTVSYGSWPFMVLSIVILVLMGALLEGAPALIIFGPLLVPVAGELGVNELHYGIVLIVAMGIGLFAPPFGVGLYGACMIGDVPIEATIRPIMKYLGVLFVCLLLIAMVPGIALWLPHSAGYR
jgi:tripartite ATP-independent transporter DctM subunit